MNKDILKKAEKAIRDFASDAPTAKGSERCLDVTLHVKGFAEPGYEAPECGIMALGDWNSISQWGHKTNRSFTHDNAPCLLQEELSKMGIETDWSDEYLACDKCKKLVRKKPDSYGWKRSFVEMDGRVLCHLCVNRRKLLKSLENQPHLANTLYNLDPADYGYSCLEDFQNGWYLGEDASPQLIAEALRAQKIDRFLFNIMQMQQFRIEFSVHVHKSQLGRLDREKFLASPLDGPSNARNLQKALATLSHDLPENPPDGEHRIKYSKINAADGTVETKFLSPQEFIEGVK